MKNPQDELVWQGRIHIGDEPGVYGDAAYSGLCAEFPMTVRPFDPTSTNEDITIVLEADNVHVFAGYAGHQVVVIGYEPDATAGPYKWKQVPLLTTVMTANHTEIKLPSLGGHKFVSTQLRVDTTVAAGLYNDFVWEQVLLRSTTHYAVVGFEN
jgi:hypothetical protein